MRCGVMMLPMSIHAKEVEDDDAVAVATGHAWCHGESDGWGLWSQAIHDRVCHRAQLKRRPSTHTAIFSFEIFSTLIIAH